MEVFPELVKILSEDVDLFDHKGRFLDALEIPRTTVDANVKLYDMGHCRAYDLIRAMLSEWIVIKKDSATIAELRRILREADLKASSDNLEELQAMHQGPIKIPELETSTNGNPPSMKTRKRPITFGLKSVVQNFTGRAEELGRLNQHFHSKECPIVLVSGLGGIGKTELVKKFALDISYPIGNGQIVKCWLSGENPQSLLNSITQFCHDLHLTTTDASGKPLGIQEMIQNIMAKLRSSEEFSRWVIIIDNVDDIHKDFKTTVQTLFEFGSDAFLLVTSRRRDIYKGKVELLKVIEMKLRNSMEFVRKSLKITDNSSEVAIKSLCEILGNFPLALNQAAAFIQQQQSTTLMQEAYKIENYLEELAKTETLGLDEDQELGYSTATLKVWVITIDRIREDYGAEGQLALDLLDAIAFINPDDIPIPFLRKLYQRFYSIEEISISQIKESSTILLNYSLISSYDEILSIHRLVQLSSRDRMSSKSPAEDGESSKCVEMLTNFWTSFDDEDKWNQIEMRNILTIWSHTSKHEELNPLRAAKILHVQHQLHRLGMVSEAYDFSEGCKFVLQDYKPEDSEYWQMECSEALALKRKGQYEFALQKFTTLHSKLKELYGAEGEVTLAVGYCIAVVLLDLDRFEESLEWAQRILQFEIKINNGEKNEDVMKTKGIVAGALGHLGRTIEALEIYHEILEWQKSNLEEATHSSVLSTMHNIAICFFEDGRFAEALKMSQEILPLKENDLGSDHPETLTTKKFLADTLFKMGKIGQAFKIYEEVLVASEKVLGAEHPQTINVQEKVTLFKQLNELVKATAPKPRKCIII